MNVFREREVTNEVQGARFAEYEVWGTRSGEVMNALDGLEMNRSENDLIPFSGFFPKTDSYASCFLLECIGLGLCHVASFQTRKSTSMHQGPEHIAK